MRWIQGSERGLSVWRRQIPQNSGGNEGEAELEKPLKEKETLVWEKEQEGAKTKTNKPVFILMVKWSRRRQGARYMIQGTRCQVHYVGECSPLLRKGLLRWHWQMCGVADSVNIEGKGWSATLAAVCGVPLCSCDNNGPLDTHRRCHNVTT